MVDCVRVRASVACYHCGHTSGEVEAEPDRPLAAGVFLPAGQPGARVELKGRLREGEYQGESDGQVHGVSLITGAIVAPVTAPLEGRF